MSTKKQLEEQFDLYSTIQLCDMYSSKTKNNAKDQLVFVYQNICDSEEMTLDEKQEYTKKFAELPQKIIARTNARMRSMLQLD